MISLDDYTNENKIKHSLKWSYIPDHIYWDSGSGKTNAFQI